ncbi:MAG: NDP-sugar synthase [Planctomycetota bacterium]
MKTVILANAPGTELAPLSDQYCTALLPVTGKPLIEHTAESLALAGVEEAFVVVSPHADRVESLLGMGDKWGMKLEYVLTRGDESTSEILRDLKQKLGDEVLLLYADQIRTPFLSTFMEQAASNHPQTSVMATVSEKPTGALIVQLNELDQFDLPVDSKGLVSWKSPLRSVDLGGENSIPVFDFPTFHEANLAVLRGDFPGLIVGGRQDGENVYVGRHSRCAPDAIQGKPVFIGSHCDVKPEAEIKNDVVLANNVVIDRRATLESTVVLPNSYIGELVELNNTIVSGQYLISVETQSVTTVTDSFLLADMMADPVGRSMGEFLSRVAAIFIFVASIPLWPVAFLASFLANPKRPFRKVRLLGNQKVVGDDGVPKTMAFVTFEGATRIPILRHLPRVRHAISGDLRITGVPPLPAEAADNRTEEWEFLRDRVPCGLIGPTQLNLPPDAPEEEKRMSDAYYAQTRTSRGDIAWFIKSFGYLFSARVWKKIPKDADVLSEPSLVDDSAPRGEEIAPTAAQEERVEDNIPA